MCTQVRSYTVEQKKKTVCFQNQPVLSVNLKYPCFAPYSECMREKHFTESVNRFYAGSAERCLARASGSYARKAAALCRKNGGVPAALVMNCQVPFAGENYLSVFADLSVFDGKRVRTKRFSQFWSAQKNALLPVSYVYHTGARQAKYVKSLICEIAEKNARRKDFTYYDNYMSIINRKFDFAASYFVPNGAAFYFDGGVLNARMREVCVFVIPFEQIDGVLKIAPGLGECRYSPDKGAKDGNNIGK